MSKIIASVEKLSNAVFILRFIDTADPESYVATATIVKTGSIGTVKAMMYVKRDFLKTGYDALLAYGIDILVWKHNGKWGIYSEI